MAVRADSLGFSVYDGPSRLAPDLPRSQVRRDLPETLMRSRLFGHVK